MTDIRACLEGLGLGQYIVAFAANNIHAQGLDTADPKDAKALLESLG